MVAATGTEFLDFQTVLLLLLVARAGVVSLLTFSALQGNDFAHRLC
jgi:hypothetical protein